VRSFAAARRPGSSSKISTSGRTRSSGALRGIWQFLLSKHAKRLPDIREELIHHIVVAGDVSWNRLRFRIGIACVVNHVQRVEVWQFVQHQRVRPQSMLQRSLVESREIVTS
jgi:hypothetical protein